MHNDLEKNARISLLQLGSAALQFGLLVGILRVFRLESRALIQLSMLTWFGFVVHALLPLRFRLPAFTALSIAGVVFTLGLSAGLWVLGLGVALLALCHVPGPAIRRVLAIGAAGLGLGWVRYSGIDTPWSEAVWPILAAMFMFRIIIYLYDLEHARERPTPAWSLAYFFMLPNVCFPLFPVVDFKKFRAGHYSADAATLYQRGVHWMFRGILHLILYRFIYFNCTLSPAEVVSAPTLLQYMLSTFMLYLRVSGHFHFIVGMLLMFGFNLPETNHLYFLASSFNDYWRRINIYWKDFMMKVCFYPAFFALRRIGEVKALALATFATFAITAGLHFYQSFWIRGAPYFSWTELIYWTILALLVVCNSLYERRYGKQKAQDDSRFTWYGAVAHALRVVAIFAIMCTMWTFWDSKTFDDWLSLWRAAGPAWIWFIVGLCGVWIASNRLQRLHRRAPERPRPTIGLPNLVARPLPRTVFIVLLFLLGLPHLHSHLGPQAIAVIRQLRDGRLNKRDLAMQNRGYYENLHHVGRLNPELQALFSKKPPDWKLLMETEACRNVDNFVGFELVPNRKTVFKRALLEVNSHGLRDQEYETRKPDGVYRIAIMGASAVMGSGVNNPEIFEALLEERMNQAVSDGGRRYELLNFAVGGYSPMIQAWLIDNRVLDFEPDAVVYFAHLSDRIFSNRNLLGRVQRGEDIPFPWARELLAKTELGPEITSVHGERELNRVADEMMRGIYGHIAGHCRARGIPAVCVVMPLVQEAISPTDLRELVDAATAGGFEVWDITDVYRGQIQTALRLAEWDSHPNARAHRLIADRLYEILSGDQQVIPFPAPAGE